MEKGEAKLEIITRYFRNLSPIQLQQLAALDGLYREWNSKINVISRKDIDSLYEKHVLHSLSLAAFFKFEAGQKIIDIGTGGGFPGIPLAIVFPQARFHLIDSIGKKIKVVEAVAAAVGLNNVSAQHIRAEEVKATFDCAVSRAVAPLKELWRWSKPLLQKSSLPASIANGLICLKGGDLAAEISESGTRPRINNIHDVFPETYFYEKFILHIPW